MLDELLRPLSRIKAFYPKLSDPAVWYTEKTRYGTRHFAFEMSVIFLSNYSLSIYGDLFVEGIYRFIQDAGDKLSGF